MVSNMHRLLLRKGRNNRSNSDFQTFLRSLYIAFMVLTASQFWLQVIKIIISMHLVIQYQTNSNYNFYAIININ